MNNYYLAVPVGEREPENDDKLEFVIYGEHEAKGVLHKKYFEKWNATHWMEPREGVLLQTEELEKLRKRIGELENNLMASHGLRVMDGANHNEESGLFAHRINQLEAEVKANNILIDDTIVMLSQEQYDKALRNLMGTLL